MFSESAKLSVREIKDWADDEAESARVWLNMAERCETPTAGKFRQFAAQHQARARWLFELLAEATVKREKT